jgi:anhydro-N-acetylmuramic acid kinase
MSCSPSKQQTYFIGLMSGTSLDGVDGALTAFPADYSSGPINTLATAYLPFPAALRAELLALQGAAENEVHRGAFAANVLTEMYAQCVERLLQQSDMHAGHICAVGVHGQTIRHRPEFGYSRQIGNPALLAELCGIDVVADFRSRDIAAGGQGAPLVPAFHQAVFAQPGTVRVVANIGGISNISILDYRLSDHHTKGFDTGPGNALMDAWANQHLGTRYDDNGKWAATGKVISALLCSLRQEQYFSMPAPKSTGRDLFHLAWLRSKLASFPNANPEDIQATLTEFTATTLADAIAEYASAAETVYVCGGGAYNGHLMLRIQSALRARQSNAAVDVTTSLGISPNHVEALAFAWLAHRFTIRRHGNLPAVTGAKGPRILGALYPA